MKTDIPFTLPDSKESALTTLRACKSVGIIWHFDDDAHDTIADASGTPAFTPERAEWCNALVDRLNSLFADEGPAEERGCVNAGAWVAAERAGWVEISND